LKEVSHVPDLKKNIISIAKFGGEGYVTYFTDKTWKVTKGALIIEKGENVDTLYLYNCIANYVNALTSTGVDTTLWHHMLSHISEKGMNIIHSRNLFPGLKHSNLKFSENCVYGKKESQIPQSWERK